MRPSVTTDIRKVLSRVDHSAVFCPNASSLPIPYLPFFQRELQKRVTVNSRARTQLTVLYVCEDISPKQRWNLEKILWGCTPVGETISAWVMQVAMDMETDVRTQVDLPLKMTRRVIRQPVDWVVCHQHACVVISHPLRAVATADSMHLFAVHSQPSFVISFVELEHSAIEADY